MITELAINKQLTLKLIQITDVQAIFNAIDTNRSHLQYWLPFVEHTKKESDTFSFVKSVTDEVERRQEVFTIWYNDQFAGLIGYKDIDYLNLKLEIGYWLIEKMTGKGIVTLSVERLVQYAFNNLKMNRIQIKCGVGNIKSSAVPKRLGFTFEGTERQGEKHGHRYIDLENYSILRKEWVD